MFILTVRHEGAGAVTVAVTVMHDAGRAGGEIVKMPGIGCRTVGNHAILTVNLLGQIACAAPGNRKLTRQSALFAAKQDIPAAENDCTECPLRMNVQDIAIHSISESDRLRTAIGQLSL